MKFQKKYFINDKEVSLEELRADLHREAVAYATNPVNLECHLQRDIFYDVFEDNLIDKLDKKTLKDLTDDYIAHLEDDIISDVVAHSFGARTFSDTKSYSSFTYRVY